MTDAAVVDPPVAERTAAELSGLLDGLLAEREALRLAYASAVEIGDDVAVQGVVERAHAAAGEWHHLRIAYLTAKMAELGVEHAERRGERRVAVVRAARRVNADQRARSARLRGGGRSAVMVGVEAIDAAADLADLDALTDLRAALAASANELAALLNMPVPQMWIDPRSGTR